jgi:zinc transporter, ZIP family
LGLVVVMAIFFHNIPEGYILAMAQSKNKNFYFKASFYSMLATFSGAILGVGLLSRFKNLDAIFLSLAAGAMLFIALHELIPESFRHRDIKTFFNGIGSALFIYVVIGLL